MDNDSMVCTVPSDFQPQQIDLLDRQEIVDQMVSLLTLISDNKESSTFALDGKWGTGKTFVLNMLENDLLQQAAGTKFLVFHYNCWQYDYYEEPLVAIVASMLDSIDAENHVLPPAVRENLNKTFAFCKPTLLKIASEICKNNLGTGVLGFLPSISKIPKNKLAIKVTKLFSCLKDSKASFDKYVSSENQEHSYDDYFSFNKTLKNAREELRKLAQRQSLVVIVDELDRCQPNYAIKVLERLHHMFSDIENCCVILAIDKSQLEHTVTQVFGDKESTKSYLKKFIDFELTLNTGTINGNFMEKYPEYFSMFDKDAITTNFSFEEFLSALFADIDMRTQEHLMDRITTIHRLLFPDDKKDYSFMCFELMLLVLTGHYTNCASAEFILKENQTALVFHQISPEAKTFAAYIKSKWVITKFYVDNYTFNPREICFSSPTDIPELLIWYQGQMVDGTYRYVFCGSDNRKCIYEKNVEDFKKVRELLQIIK